MDRDEHASRFCDCAFCIGAFAEGTHPLDLLLEEREVLVAGARRKTPTPSGETLNTWHHLLARGKELQAFAAAPASEVIARDMERARSMADPDGAERLRRLAGRLRTAASRSATSRS